MVASWRLLLRWLRPLLLRILRLRCHLDNLSLLSWLRSRARPNSGDRRARFSFVERRKPHRFAFVLAHQTLQTLWRQHVPTLHIDRAKR